MKTILFGAGASYGFFDPDLSTSELTNAVLNPTNWVRVVDEYNKHKAVGYDVVDANTISGFLNCIDKRFYQHFEQLAEVVDKVSSYGFDSNPVNNLFNLVLHTMFNPATAQFDAKWLPVPFLFRQIIAETILDKENNHKSAKYQSLIDEQRNFIDLMCKKDNNISVVSLNYDDCVFESLKGLGFDKCFLPTTNNRGLQLDIQKFMNTDRVVYFPHGHLKFSYLDNKNASFHYDSNEANKDRWESIRQGTFGASLFCTNSKFAYNFNTFLTTGQTKDDSLNNQPYSIYYERLAIDIAKSDTIYLIGYSFGDEHFNRLLNSFLKMNSQNKVVIVDFVDFGKKITAHDEFQDENNIITKIYGVLDREVVYDVNNVTGLPVPRNITELDKLNAGNLGHGYLFEQVFFYRKGYEAFLKEYPSLPL